MGEQERTLVAACCSVFSLWFSGAGIGLRIESSINSSLARIAVWHFWVCGAPVGNEGEALGTYSVAKQRPPSFNNDCS